MSQQDASATRPCRGLVLDTRALAVSKLGCTNLIFVEPGATLNGQYYRDMLLMQKLLPTIRSIAGDVFVIQQDNAPAHHARDTVELQRRETPQFISPDMWPADSPGLNPVEPCLGHAARAHVSSTNPRYGRVAEESCCDMGRFLAERGGGGRCS